MVALTWLTVHSTHCNDTTTESSNFRQVAEGGLLTSALAFRHFRDWEQELISTN
jgi:hypothetical protein